MANYCSFMVTEKTFRVEDPMAFENELQRLRHHTRQLAGRLDLHETGRRILLDRGIRL